MVLSSCKRSRGSTSMVDPDRLAYTIMVLPFGAILSNRLVSLPATASKKRVTLSWPANFLSSVSKWGPDEFNTYLAPCFFNSSTCSSLLTILMRGSFSRAQILINICPNTLAAALLTIARCFPALAIVMNPRTVSGFTISIAPCSISIFFPKGITFMAEVTIYSAQVPPFPTVDEQATLFPSLSLANNPPPEATTVPLPSIPGVCG